MSQELISHSPDLKRLRDEGYEIEIKNGYALVHHVPYVNANREIEFGTLISTLSLAGNQTTSPDNHVIYFNGNHPCNINGSLITGIQHTSGKQILGEGIISNHSFSNKPSSGYENYYEKFTRYIEIIMAPAYSLEQTVTAKTYITSHHADDSVFHYYDTNSSRANIDVVTEKLKYQKIGILGLGGTGSYILDLISKTPVTEIHLFDGDVFLQHNAFRAPGAPSLETLKEKKLKTEYLRNIYSNMHKSIISHNNYIDETNIHDILTLDFIFICIDDGVDKKVIIEELVKWDKSFIDVGVGIELIDESLIGDIRVTTSTPGKRDHLLKRISFTNAEADEYSSNIQIADLNALNAVMAVIKWKKINGFYQDIYKELHTTYTINTGDLNNAYE